MENTEYTYLDSFAREKEFTETNRFKKFERQMKLHILDAMKFLSMDVGTPSTREDNTLEKFIFSTVADYFIVKTGDLVFEDEYYEDLEEKQFDQINSEYLKANPDVALDCAFLTRHPHFTNYNNVEIKDAIFNYEDQFKEIITEVAREQLIEYIAYKAGVDEETEMNEFNYAKRILAEDNLDEELKLFNDIVMETCYRFEQFLFTTNNYKPQTEKKSNEKELINQNKELQKKIEKLEKELNQKDINNKTLVQKLEKTEKNLQKTIKDEVDIFKETIAKLNKQIKILEKENEELKEKIVVPEVKDNVEEETIDFLDIDFTKLNLAFVTTEYSPFINELEKTFPNCRVLYKNFDIDYSNYDFVVVLTAHMSHPVYWTVKNRCEKSNTQLILCDKTNIDKIKDTILKYM